MNELTQVLDEIEARGDAAEACDACPGCPSCGPAAQDRPKLVQALRRSLKGLDKVKAYPGGVADIAYATTADITEILTENHERTETNTANTRTDCKRAGNRC